MSALAARRSRMRPEFVHAATARCGCTVARKPGGATARWVMSVRHCPVHAAAPALLAALRALVDEIMAEHGGGADLLAVHPDFDPEHYALIVVARAALAKAVG